MENKLVISGMLTFHPYYKAKGTGKNLMHSSVRHMQNGKAVTLFFMRVISLSGMN
jgi:hypothetical protein